MPGHILRVHWTARGARRHVASVTLSLHPSSVYQTLCQQKVDISERRDRNRAAGVLSAWTVTNPIGREV